MNANRMINMVIRMVMRRVMRSGMNAGIGAIGKKMNKGKTEDGNPSKDAPETKDTQKRARQSMKMARRMGRM